MPVEMPTVHAGLWDRRSMPYTVSPTIISSVAWRDVGTSSARRNGLYLPTVAFRRTALAAKRGLLDRYSWNTIESITVTLAPILLPVLGMRQTTFVPLTESGCTSI